MRSPSSTSPCFLDSNNSMLHWRKWVVCSLQGGNFSKMVQPLLSTVSSWICFVIYAHHITSLMGQRERQRRERGSTYHIKVRYYCSYLGLCALTHKTIITHLILVWEWRSAAVVQYGISMSSFLDFWCIIYHPEAPVYLNFRKMLKLIALSPRKPGPLSPFTLPLTFRSPWIPALSVERRRTQEKKHRKMAR